MAAAGASASASDPKRTVSYDCQPCFPGSDPSRPSLTVWGLSSLPLRHHCSAASIGDGYGGRTNGSRSKPRNSLLDATACASPSASCIAARVRRLSLPKAYQPRPLSLPTRRSRSHTSHLKQSPMTTRAIRSALSSLAASIGSARTKRFTPSRQYTRYAIISPPAPKR